MIPYCHLYMCGLFYINSHKHPANNQIVHLQLHLDDILYAHINLEKRDDIFDGIGNFSTEFCSIDRDIQEFL